MAEYTRNDEATDWNDVIEDDGQEFIILPEGDYNFTVTNFERGYFPGSAKMKPCNKATITMQVHTEDGIASIRTDLILNRILEWRISAFFRSIGKKKHGEHLAMDWNNVVGQHGRAHFKPRTYTDREGKERQANDVDRFYDYDAKYFPEDNTWVELTDDSEDLPF